MKNKIGLDQDQAKQLSAELNNLLSSYQIFYSNVRGYHWNIKGLSFFQLHEKFEEVYTDLITKIDDIAERILTLDSRPLHAYSDYLQQTQIKEHKNATSASECLDGILSGLSTLIVKQREILALAAEANDEGTVSLMSDYIKEQEKSIWMFNATSSCSQCG